MLRSRNMATIVRALTMIVLRRATMEGADAILVRPSPWPVATGFGTPTSLTSLRVG